MIRTSDSPEIHAIREQRAILDKKIWSLQVERGTLSDKLHALLISESPIKVGDILAHRDQDFKVVRVAIDCGGDVQPIVVAKKKDGTWGTRERKTYSFQGWKKVEAKP